MGYGVALGAEMLEIDGNAASAVVIGMVLGLGAVASWLQAVDPTDEEQWAAARERIRRLNRRMEMSASVMMMSRVFGAYGRAELEGTLRAVRPTPIYRAPEVRIAST